jgi:hypothetical protein
MGETHGQGVGLAAVSNFNVDAGEAARHDADLDV